MIAWEVGNNVAAVLGDNDFLLDPSRAGPVGGTFPALNRKDHAFFKFCASFSAPT